MLIWEALILQYQTHIEQLSWPQQLRAHSYITETERVVGARTQFLGATSDTCTIKATRFKFNARNNIIFIRLVASRIFNALNHSYTDYWDPLAAPVWILFKVLFSSRILLPCALLPCTPHNWNLRNAAWLKLWVKMNLNRPKVYRYRVVRCQPSGNTYV